MIGFSPPCTINAELREEFYYSSLLQLRDFYRPRVLAPEDPELLFPLEPDDELSVFGV